MIKLFKGRSDMTHQMKKKPIKEGYKFFTLCDTQAGFCYVSFPDGLKDKSGMIWEKAVNLVHFLPDHGKRKYVGVGSSWYHSDVNFFRE